mgnify:CR=1 FL=1
MLPGSKVITLVEKKRKEVAWLGLELTTSHLEVQCANHYTMETFMMNMYFFKCHHIKVITFEPGNIFELTWYSEWPLVCFTWLMNHVIYLKLRKKLLLLQAEQIHKMTTGPF